MKHLERALDGQNQFWKYLVNFIVSFVSSNLIGAIPLVAVIAFKTYQNGGVIAPNPNNVADLSVYGISTNFGLLLLMIPFIFGLLSVILLLKPLHKRSLTEVVNGTMTIRWKRFFYGAGIWLLLSILYLIVDHTIIDPTNYVLQFDIKTFIPLVFISLILIPFQTTFEEILFRGYLGQALAGWTKNRWLVIIVPALLFGLMHITNPEVKEYGFWATMPQYVFFGLIFGLITVLDDGIELAMGVHAANNIFFSLFITNKSSVLQTAAVFNQQQMKPYKETLMLAVLGVILIFILAKKYHWNFGILNKKVESLETEVEVIQ